MGIAGTKRGETARRIYAVLKRNPGLARAEVAAYMPDLTPNAVACMISKMKKDGSVELRGRKMLRPDATVGAKTAPTYHVKYKSGAVPPKPKAKRKAKKVHAQATWSVADIKHEKPKGVNIVTETIIPHVDAKLQAAYERLAMLHTETMAELAEEKKKVHLCDSWWCRMKRKFA